MSIKTTTIVYRGSINYDPWNKSRTPLSFIKCYWHTVTSIHLCIICGCFCMVTAKLSSHNKSTCPKSPKYLPRGANTCSRKLIRYKQAGPPVLGSPTPTSVLPFPVSPWNWMYTAINAVWADRPHFEPHYYMPWKMYTSYPQFKPSIFDNIQSYNC